MAKPNIPPEMRQRIHPVVFTGATVCALVILAVLLWKAVTDRPVYKGLNAPHPAAEMRSFRGRWPGAGAGPPGGPPGMGGPRRGNASKPGQAPAGPGPKGTPPGP